MTYYCSTGNCDGQTKVMQTHGTYRRRKCLTCGTLFLTEEIEYAIPPGQKNPFTLANEDRKDERQNIGA